MNPGVNFHAFHRRRKMIKLTGYVLVVGGLFTILDLMAEIPIPLTGFRAVFAGAMLMVGGFVALYHGYKLPLAEALELIHQRGRGITEAELVHEMRVDRATAGRIIAVLIRQGFLRRASTVNTEEVFEPVR